ncbi:hypothetical protein H1R20_g11316, partial [Candolleomyces eurysporus]
MTKTRRKAREDAAHEEEEGPSHAGAATSLPVPVPDDIDLDHLSELLPNIPNLSLVTADAVAVLYKLVVGQNEELDSLRRDVDTLNAEVERKDVELDQALQDKETLSQEMGESVDSVQSELQQVKQERDKLAGENNALKAQISSLSTSQFSSSSAVDSLKHQLDDTEREKRDLLGVISRLKEEGAQREEEIHTLRSNLKEARQEHQSLESQIRDLKSTEASTKFKVETLTQHLKLAQAEAERTSNELTSKAEEYTKYRRTKHAETLDLQSRYDSLSQEHTATSASLRALQSAHSAQTNQLSQSLSKIQALSGQLAEQESKYASEVNSMKRLIAVMEDREKQAKDIVEKIETQWASMGEKTGKREAELQQQIERESRLREEAEKRVDNLETVIHRMGHGELPLPGTPFRTPGGVDGLDGMMGISPTVALASRSQRAGKTFTEVYADYVRLQAEYNSKCLEHEQMERTLTNVLAEIEERAPILSQQRAEYERVKDEASQLSAQLSAALSECDAQTSLTQDQGQKLKKLNAENGLLQKQLNDLGRQVQTLLREIARRDDPTIPSDEELEEMPFTPADNVDEVITSHLVLFRNIEGLQQQNQKLLKITRELGEKMESEEQEYKQAMEQEQAEAIREAHEAMQQLAQQLEDQKRGSDARIQAYVKERDALKSMLTRAQGAGTHGLVVNGSTPALPENEIARELAEIQSQFEAYRSEMGVDSARLRDDLSATQREALEFEAALAKANAKIEYLDDRNRINQDHLNLKTLELKDLNQRHQGLMDQFTRVDVECSRVADELAIANGRLEQMRNECANLRAEKNIWESIQTRLVEENKALSMERAHLSDLMTNIQRMHNDLERSGENDRRRLEGQLQMLESQNQDLRTQLSRERDSLRHVSLQKELESKEQQGRLDKANQELAKTRESLVIAETSKKHLEDRLEDLSKQLQGIQEKLGVYERRPSTTTSGPAPSANPDLSREQQLEQEVAELRSALKVAEVDLASSRGHVEQFKDISQANEVALSNLNATFDEYKTSTENQLAIRESEYKALQEKLEAANTELTQLREQLSSINKTFEEERAAWKNDKKTLEDTIVDMTTSEKHLETDRASREHEIRSIEERAKDAEQGRDNAVLAHAESIKTIEQLRKDLAAAQTKAREGRTAAETAEAKLTASETSWKAQRETLDKEISDMKTRCQDLTAQNSILHQHLESVSSQATRIRQAAEDSSTAVVGEGDASADDTDTKLAELRSVVSYLRKEKEIVDLQLELGKQENARLKAQIDHLGQSLQEARSTISEERERAVESAASAAQHAELVERINQLNILRESNATLRADCESHAKRARELDEKLRQLSSELEPAKEQARFAQAELEVCRGQIQRLEQESRSWQDRNRQLLSKYDRVDPAELQALKDENEKLKAEVEQLQKDKAELEQAVAAKQTAFDDQSKTLDEVRAQFTRAKDAVKKNNEIFRNKMQAKDEEKSQLEAKIAELEANAATAEAPTVPDPALAEQLKRQEVVIGSLRSEKEKLLAERASLLAEKDKLVAEKEELAKSRAAAPAQEGATEGGNNWDAEKAELVQARDEALEKLKVAGDEVQKASEETKNIRMQNEKYAARIAALNKARAADQERTAAAVAEAVGKAKSEFAASASGTPEEIVAKHAKDLESLRKQLEQQHKAELNSVREEASQAASQAAAPAGRTDASEKALEEKHLKEIEEARESGRIEYQMKVKLKDSQLTKASNRRRGRG